MAVRDDDDEEGGAELDPSLPLSLSPSLPLSLSLPLPLSPSLSLLQWLLGGGVVQLQRLAELPVFLIDELQGQRAVQSLQKERKP